MRRQLALLPIRLNGYRHECSRCESAAAGTDRRPGARRRARHPYGRSGQGPATAPGPVPGPACASSAGATGRRIADQCQPQPGQLRGRWAQPLCPDALADYPGPLAGLAAGLAACRTPYLASVPCDSPNFPVDLVAAAGGGACARRRRDRDGCGGRGRPAAHPARVLPAALQPCCTSLMAFLQGGHRKVDRWTALHRYVIVPFDDAAAFFNANTLDELGAIAAESLITSRIEDRPLRGRSRAGQVRHACRPCHPGTSATFGHRVWPTAVQNSGMSARPTLTSPRVTFAEQAVLALLLETTEQGFWFIDNDLQHHRRQPGDVPHAGPEPPDARPQHLRLRRRGQRRDLRAADALGAAGRGRQLRDRADAAPTAAG